MNPALWLLDHLPLPCLPLLIFLIRPLPDSDCGPHYCYTYAQCETHCYDDQNHWYYCTETCKT